MPSNEDYKDKILDENEESFGGADAPDIDAVTELSEEEIDRLLSAGAEAGSRQEEASGAKENFPEDVVDMLEDSEDEDLWSIQDMLKKSDRNETVDPDALDEPEEDESPADRLLADIEDGAEEAPRDSKTRKALEKRRMKEEKAARKKAAKEAAKAKKEEKRRQKKGGANAKALEDIERLPEESNEVKEFDLLLDKDLLDSIVSEADNLKGEPSKAEKASAKQEQEDADEREDLFMAASQKEDLPVRPERGDVADSPESGILELDMDEVDALIPDISAEPKEEEAPKEKRGLMSKLLTFLMEEEPEPENENIKLSEENQEILDELDGEGAAGGKGKKKAKKPDKKKPKKEAKKKAPKASKPKKPPKEKKPKETEPYLPGKKITFKKALPVLLLGATIGAVTFLFVYLSADYSLKQEALAAYEKGDYETCYLKLQGRKLDEEQEKMYGKAESILYLQLKYRKYELLLGEGFELEALDSLIQTIYEYPTVYRKAAACGAEQEIEEIYSNLLNALYERYGISETDALTIARLESDIAYTRAVTALAEGEGYGVWNAQPEQAPVEEPAGVSAEEDGGEQEGQSEDGLPEASQEGQEELPDALPEEESLGDRNFMDD